MAARISIPHAICGHNKERVSAALAGDIGGACVRPNASNSATAFMEVQTSALGEELVRQSGVFQKVLLR